MIAEDGRLFAGGYYVVPDGSRVSSAGHLTVAALVYLAAKLGWRVNWEAKSVRPPVAADSADPWDLSR